jgi:hypothetical protein
MNVEDIHNLLHTYLDILKLEVETFNCKPTEVRHLIGRIGEFICAIHVNGQLTRVPNQHGFDVLDPFGKRISVKTTAQKTGFISLNKNTMEDFDFLMVIQFFEMTPKIIYFDSIENLKKLPLRTWSGNPNKYELDLTLAKRSNPKPL